MNRSRLITVLALFGLAALVGCAPKTVQKSAPAGDGKFVDQAHKFSVEFPKPWKQKNNVGKEDVLTIGRDGKKGEIAIAVPKLPFHIPGMIPLEGVEKGYIDNAKKRLKNVKVMESKPVKIAGVNARRFSLEGDAAEGHRKLAVLAIVNGDTVYIVTGESGDAEFHDVLSAFEQVARSWKWM